MRLQGKSQQDRINVLKRRGKDRKASSLYFMGTQRKGGHLPGVKMALTSNQICWHLDIGLTSLPNGEGNGTPLQYSCLENPMDGGAWWAAEHGVVKSWTRLRDFTFTFHSHALEKEMATHSSVLAWRTPGTEEPGRLLSLGLHRVGHD